MEKSLIDLLWINLSAILVFFMQAGFAMLEAGLTRSKNSINVAMKNIVDLSISSLIYWAIGFGIMFGLSNYGFFGSNLFLFNPRSAWDFTFFFFEVVFCSTSATIVSGAVAERMKFTAYMISTILMSLLIYPVTGHWAWGGAMEGSPSGWLAKLGFIDFAGSTVVHSVGGWVALAILLILGPRRNIFDSETGEIKFVASNIPIAIAGVFILWFGWFGFNGGSGLVFNESAPTILTNTLLATSSGMIFTMLTGFFITKKFNVEFAINGALGGLVSITANCHCVTTSHSLIIGAIGGIVTIIFSSLLIKLKIDDAVSAIPVHLGAGIWGTLAVAIFGEKELIGTGLSFIDQLKIQTIGIISIGVWAFGLSFIFMSLINIFFKLRISEEEEEIGLNYVEHGAKTESYELLKTIQLQATTGDLSYRVKEEPFSEMGVISHYYNKALDEIQKNVVSKKDYIQILDNIDEGIFLLNKDFSIAPAYSKNLEKIFENDTLENKNFLEVIKPHIPEQILSNIKDYLSFSFDMNIKENLLRNLNPMNRLEFTFLINQESISKFLSFKVIRIKEENEIKRLMVIVKDETQNVNIEKEKEIAKIEMQSEMELIYKILHIDYEIFKDFLDELKQKISTINNILETNNLNTIKENIDLIYRYIHTIKGNSRLLEFNFISNKCHEIEEEIQNIKNKKDLSTDIFIPLLIKLSELHSLTRKLDELIIKLKNFNRFEKGGNDKIIYSLKKFVDNLSKEYKKKISLLTERFNFDMIPKYLRVEAKDIIVQLIKNSILHGIEEEKIRTEKGKNPTGIIELKTEEDENYIYISVKDDGSGINYEKIKLNAIKNKLIDKNRDFSKEELIKFIFEKSFSTSEKTNIDAGRGIGLDIVYEWIRKNGGKIIIKNEVEKFCEFTLAIEKRKVSL